MEKLSGILAFVRAAETRSFSQAAKQLEVTASGVGKSISRLETELGVRLLNRTTRRVSLTDDGALFYEDCRRILDDLDAARCLVMNRSSAAQGRLRVSLPTTLGKLCVIPRLPAFLHAHPLVTLEVCLSDRWVALIEEGIDVALRIGRLADSSLVAKPLWQQQLVTLAAPGYLQGRDLDDTGMLVKHRCLVFRQPTSGQERPWSFRAGQQDVELRPRAFLTLDEGEALVEAARAGLGVIQVPGYMAHDAISRGELREVLRSVRPRPMPIAAVYSSQRNLPARIRAFVDWLAGLPGPASP